MYIAHNNLGKASWYVKVAVWCPYGREVTREIAPNKIRKLHEKYTGLEPVLGFKPNYPLLTEEIVSEVSQYIAEKKIGCQGKYVSRVQIKIEWAMPKK